MQIAQCYIQNLRSIKKNNGEKIWDILKNIEVEEKQVQKKEELVKEINVNKPLSGRYKSNQKGQRMDFYIAGGSAKLMLTYISKLQSIRKYIMFSKSMFRR